MKPVKNPNQLRSFFVATNVTVTDARHFMVDGKTYTKIVLSIPNLHFQIDWETEHISLLRTDVPIHFAKLPDNGPLRTAVQFANWIVDEFGQTIKRHQ